LEDARGSLQFEQTGKWSEMPWNSMGPSYYFPLTPSLPSACAAVDNLNPGPTNPLLMQCPLDVRQHGGVRWGTGDPANCHPTGLSSQCLANNDENRGSVLNADVSEFASRLANLEGLSSPYYTHDMTFAECEYTFVQNVLEIGQANSNTPSCFKHQIPTTRRQTPTPGVFRDHVKPNGCYSPAVSYPTAFSPGHPYPDGQIYPAYPDHCGKVPPGYTPIPPSRQVVPALSYGSGLMVGAAMNLAASGLFNAKDFASDAASYAGDANAHFVNATPVDQGEATNLEVACPAFNAVYFHYLWQLVDKSYVTALEPGYISWLTQPAAGWSNAPFSPEKPGTKATEADWTFQFPLSSTATDPTTGQPVPFKFLDEGPDSNGVVRIPGCGSDLSDKSLLQAGAARILIDAVTNGGLN
jgi:hypothetical protein